MRTFSEFIATMKRDYVLTYTFVSKNKDDKSDEYFREHFVIKLRENTKFSSFFGPEDFDQTTIAFNSNAVNHGVVKSELYTIISQLLKEYRKDDHNGYNYHEDCKLFLMHPEVDEKHLKIAHIIIDDLSNAFAAANKQ